MVGNVPAIPKALSIPPAFDGIINELVAAGRTTRAIRLVLHQKHGLVVEEQELLTYYVRSNHNARAGANSDPDTRIITHFDT